MAKGKLRMNPKRRAVLVALAHIYATEQRGATVAEITDVIKRRIRRVNVSDNYAYQVLMLLKTARLTARREGRHGSWKPTHHGLVYAARYVETLSCDVAVSNIQRCAREAEEVVLT